MTTSTSTRGGREGEAGREREGGRGREGESERETGRDRDGGREREREIVDMHETELENQTFTDSFKE
jgi:hypothetical protein